MLMNSRRRTRSHERPRFAGLEPLDPRRMLSTYFVDDNSPNPAGDGLTWSNAFASLQQALAAAQAGDEVRVGQGTYKPTTGTNATVSFVLKNNVRVVGGYAGSGHAAAPDTRNDAAYATILSGDIGAAGVITDNSHHVVVGSGTNATAVLDGFTITGGFAAQEANGGGMYNVAGSPTVQFCTFVNNRAEFGDGGAVFNYQDSIPAFYHCVFADNFAYDGG